MELVVNVRIDRSTSGRSSWTQWGVKLWNFSKRSCSDLLRDWVKYERVRVHRLSKSGFTAIFESITRGPAWASPERAAFTATLNLLSLIVEYERVFRTSEVWTSSIFKPLEERLSQWLFGFILEPAWIDLWKSGFHSNFKIYTRWMWSMNVSR